VIQNMMGETYEQMIAFVNQHIDALSNRMEQLENDHKDETPDYNILMEQLSSYVEDKRLQTYCFLWGDKLVIDREEQTVLERLREHIHTIVTEMEQIEHKHMENTPEYERLMSGLRSDVSDKQLRIGVQLVNVYLDSVHNHESA
ncbi:MAG TPA: hypothetical protein V6C97_35670, partial [Oculatellaceae cyanobacterium]